MSKEIQGSCNRCGLCGCISSNADPDLDWAPGIPCGILDHYLWAPDNPEANKFAKYIVTKLGYTYGSRGGKRINIPGLGRVDFWISDHGIQKSETDRSCPFHKLGNPNECLIWDKEFIHPSCRNTPQKLNEAQALRWSEDHPTCGFYWVDV